MTSEGGRVGGTGGRYVVAVSLAVAVVVIDLITKRWAASTFTSQPEEVIGTFLRFRYVENTGAAFSMFQGAGAVFGVAAVLVVGAILWFLRQARNGWEIAGFALVIGGATGNLIDRVARGSGFLDGAVIDWVDLWIIPTFNVADASITVAVVLLLMASWLSD